MVNVWKSLTVVQRVFVSWTFVNVLFLLKAIEAGGAEGAFPPVFGSKAAWFVQILILVVVLLSAVLCVPAALCTTVVFQVFPASYRSPDWIPGVVFLGFCALLSQVPYVLTERWDRRSLLAAPWLASVGATVIAVYWNFRDS